MGQNNNGSDGGAPLSDELLGTIRQARNALSEARNSICTCSGFVIQREGCQCEHAKIVNGAEHYFWRVIHGL